MRRKKLVEKEIINWEDNLTLQEIYSHFIKLHELFSKTNHEIRLVGGSVRDIFLSSYCINDFDFATTATPEEMLAFTDHDYNIIETGKDHGTLTFVDQDNNHFEITTLRKDNNCDGRYAEVEFTDSWKEDAARRDFTINAMSLDINGIVYDYFNGLFDINDNDSLYPNIEFVGEMEERLDEDILRILRLVRFHVKYEVPMELYKKAILRDWVLNNSLKFLKLSPERIWLEFKKSAECFECGYDFIFLCGEIGLLKHIKFPEKVEPRDEIDSNVLCGDTGYLWPIAYHILYNQYDINTFADDLKLSNNERSSIMTIIRHSVFTELKHEDDIKKIVWKYKNLKIPEYLIEAAINTICKKNDYKKLWNIDVFPKFPIDGNDIIEYFDLDTGKEVGKIREVLFDLWIQSGFEKSKKELLKVLKYYYEIEES